MFKQLKILLLITIAMPVLISAMVPEKAENDVISETLSPKETKIPFLIPMFTHRPHITKVFSNFTSLETKRLFCAKCANLI